VRGALQANSAHGASPDPADDDPLADDDRAQLARFEEFKRRQGPK
jgi:hypothetical protein